MQNNIKGRFLERVKYRKLLLSLVLIKFSRKNWLLRRDTTKQINQLSHDECEALWAKINFTLQTIN
jgi:hypothetical protein